MWNWYKLFNLTEWQLTGLVSRTLSLNLNGLGQKDILITEGNETCITIDDDFLPLNFGDKNPWVDGDRAIYLDADNNVWLGVQVS